jgi:uncharacterized membrane protein
MTGTIDAATDRRSERQTYRRLFYGLVLAATVGFVGLQSLDYPLAAATVYALGALGMYAVLLGTPISLFDEREAQLERTATWLAVNVTAAVVIFGMPLSVILEATGTWTPGPLLEGAFLAYVAQAVLFAVIYVPLRYRR